ncbi:S41 family peptidase [Eudoraea chungangensis]|uniref:S41 family peptidase n=1 Tax=Eudoraea chungangensis TaxID=1481905 RepID=UPI0023EAE4E7|nr:S41 family peptidase [Eudoraea chungangensis]
MKLNFLFFLLITNSCLVLAQNQFSKYDVLSDLVFLKTSLEKTHINLYAYTSKEEFAQNYYEVKKDVEKKDSLSLLETINQFQKVAAKANNAHTRIPFPVETYIAFAQAGGTIFPLELAFENGKALLRKNWSNKELKLGAVLKTINGKDIEDILQEIYPQISAERLYFKNAQLEMLSFPRYFWRVFGEYDEFEVVFKENGVLSTYKLKAIRAIEDYEMKRNDILKRDMKLSFLPSSTAYLQPGDFGGDLVKYQQFIDSAFMEIRGKFIENLIIDLRNHSGGDDAFGDYLVSYIANKPFNWNSKFQLKSSKLLKEDVRKNRDSTERYWKSILMHKDGEIYDYEFKPYQPQRRSKRYDGQVYVLVNRQSYSQSTVTAAQIQDHGFGIIVGEETGEYPNLYASIFSYKLPKTGIGVDTSKGRIFRVSGAKNNRGVIPDIIIKDQLLDEKDEVLDGLLEKLN